MPSRVGWYLDKRVIYGHFYDVVAVATIEHGARYMAKLMDMADVPVHIVFNTTEMQKISGNLLRVKQVSAPTFSHPNIGWSIVVMPNMQFDYVVQTVLKLFRVQSRIVKTLDEGVRFLQQTDTALMDMSCAIPDMTHFTVFD